jgi:hypothetical protein
LPGPFVVVGTKHRIDITKLNALLADINPSKTRRSREAWIKIYHEARMKETPGRGLSFNDALMILSQHKLIDVNEALE